MMHLAARTLAVTDPAAIAVVGDTPSDIQAGRAAAASVVGGVLTGTGTRARHLPAACGSMNADPVDVLAGLFDGKHTDTDYAPWTPCPSSAAATRSRTDD